MTDWLDPLNKMIWFDAFRDRAKVVTLSDGRVFDLDYDRQPGKVWVAARKEVAPCGWFDLQTAANESWLGPPQSVLPKGPTVYDKIVKEFIEFDVPGVSVLDQWPELLNKGSASIVNGFKRALTTVGTENIEFMKSKDKMILINRGASDVNVNGRSQPSEE